MKELFNRKIGGLRVMLHEAEESDNDPRKCWVHRSTNEDGTKGEYEIRRWFSVESVSNMRWPLLRVIAFKWMVMFYCTWMKEKPPTPGEA